MAEKRSTTYFYASRDHLNGLLFVLPLLLCYQVLLFFQNFQNLNGVDFLTPLLFHYGGKKLLTGFHFFLLFLFVTIYSSAKEKENFRLLYYPCILLESLFYSFALIVIINIILKKAEWPVASFGATLFLLFLPYFYFVLEEKKRQGLVRLFLVFCETAMLLLFAGLAYLVYLTLKEVNWSSLSMEPLMEWAVKSVGAGVHEELVFRLGLFGGLFYVTTKYFSWQKYPAFLIAAVVSSLLFALAHHIGPYGEPMELFPLIFRFLAGVIFCIIFLLRGFATAVYTHAMYNFIVFSKEIWMQG